MSFKVKTKIAGFLRSLWGRSDQDAPARPAASVAPASAPAPAPVRPAAPRAPAPIRTPTAAPTPASAPTPYAGDSDEVELPLASVVAGLPMDMRAKLMAAPSPEATIRVSAEMIVGQLAFGAVKISFGELRRLAPGTFVNSGGEMDNKLVSLPLQEILPRLNPAWLSRRPVKKVEVAEEITGPFADRGRGFTFTTQPLKAPPVKPPSPPPPTVAFSPAPPIPIAPANPAPLRPAATRQAPPPPPPSFTPRSTTPAPSSTASFGHAPIAPVPLSPLSPRPVPPPTGLGTNGHGQSNHGTDSGSGFGAARSLPPGLRVGPLSGEAPVVVPPPKVSPPPAPPAPTALAAPMSVPPAALPPAPAPAKAAAPAPAGPAIFVRLGDLCENWPSELKEQILESPLGQAEVALDGTLLLPGLKRGRVVVPWKRLRLLAQPDSGASPIDHLELELPLKVIAPLFLAAQKPPARPQTRAAVSETIPDLFFGFPQPASAPPAPVKPVAAVAPLAPAVSTPSPLPVSAPPAPAPKPAESASPDTNYFSRADQPGTPTAEDPAVRRTPAPQTDFLSRLAHPKEVVAATASLAGVVGAVVAMQDGLRVASQVPAEFNADTLAAFLPQIYERVNQSTRELRMGPLNNISFTVGNVPWRIFRVNSVYFAAFGRAGEPMPSAQLALLAAQLDRKQTQ